jgi:hemerythrin-like domain-containing protein
VRAATDVLRDEHRVILQALTTLERAAETLGAGRPLPDGLWTALLEWLRAFADRQHHAKEERVLFPALINAGLPADGGPITVMLGEHAEGRHLLQAMETGSAEARAAAAVSYVHLLREHIDKENSVLFPLADTLFDAQDHAAVARVLANAETQGGVDAAASALTALPKIS